MASARVALPRSVVVAVVLMAIQGLVGTTPAAANCAPRQSRAIVEAGSVRVYRVRNGDVFGCHRRARQALRLVDADGGDSTERLLRPAPRVSGRFVAAVVYWEDAMSYGVTVEVADLRAAKFTFTGEAEGPPLIGSVDQSPGAVSDLELLPSGAAAWITSRAENYGRLAGRGCGSPPPAPEDVCQVNAVTRRGKRRQLDSGADVRIFSLRRIGSEVEWVNGQDRRRSAVD